MITMKQNSLSTLTNEWLDDILWNINQVSLKKIKLISPITALGENKQFWFILKFSHHDPQISNLTQTEIISNDIHIN